MSHFVGHLKLTQLHKAIGFQKKKKRNSTLLKTASTDMDHGAKNGFKEGAVNY